LVTNPDDRNFYTTEQCELINGIPFKPEDQDTIEALLTVTDQELDFWDKINVDPNYIYELASEGYKEFI